MNSFGNFLWKIFSVTMVFLCHIDSDRAFAAEVTEEPEPTPLSDVASVAADPKMTTKYFTSTAAVDAKDGYKRTTQLCKSGQYLSSCGSSQIGTSWLKGLKKTGNVKTPDYYSYDTQDTDTINMENLKKMFAHTEALTYTSKTSSGSGYILTNTAAFPEEYKWHLYQLLSNFCTNDNGKISSDSIHCLPCPNNAYVERSTVQEDVYDTGKILWDSWNVHTIADCYMNEFEDTDGTYVYVPANSQDVSSKEHCYYTKNVYGTSLYYN